MTRLDQQPDVKALAEELGLDWERNAVGNIVSFCHRKLDRWISANGPVRSITELERLISREMGLVFEEVWSDDDLTQLIRRYISLGEIAFASLPLQLEGEGFGTLMRRTHVEATAPDRFVAVIDCRGPKSDRRFFTRWHETAHLLTGCFRGSPSLESLMDLLAAEFAFYSRLFLPVMVAGIPPNGNLTFAAVRQVRDRYCAEASMQATTQACIRHFSGPVVYLEAGLGLKKHQQKEFESPQMALFADEGPRPVLRVLTILPNQAARDAGLRIDRNMAVPDGSLIAQVYSGAGTGEEYRGEENLGTWIHSDGKALPAVPVHIEARCHSGQVIALVRPRAGVA